MYEILLGVFLLVALMLVGAILLQQGKGADMGASFGAGGANTVFGATGAAGFLVKLTWWLAAIALVLVLSLAYLSSNRSPIEQQDIFTEQTAPAVEATPAAPVSDVPASDVPAADAAPASDTPN